MNYNYEPQDNSARAKGVAIVVGVHVLVGWALVSGLARKAVEVIKKPLEATVIQEVKLPPPPPPPPPPPKLIKPPEIKAPPKVIEPPPPPFIPPPEVTPPPQPAAPAIVATPTPPPAPPPIAPPPPPPPPPAPPAAPAPPVSIATICPTQVKPEIPRKALQEGISGVVRAQAVIHNGQVKEVTILSGPRIYHSAVRAAMMQYKCQTGGDVVATQEFDFKVE